MIKFNHEQPLEEIREALASLKTLIDTLAPLRMPHEITQEKSERLQGLLDNMQKYSVTLTRSMQTCVNSIQDQNNILSKNFYMSFLLVFIFSGIALRLSKVSIQWSNQSLPRIFFNKQQEFTKSSLHKYTLAIYLSSLGVAFLYYQFLKTYTEKAKSSLLFNEYKYASEEFNTVVGYIATAANSHLLKTDISMLTKIDTSLEYLLNLNANLPQGTQRPEARCTF